MRVVVAFAVALAAKQARAEYVAPPECPSEEEFRGTAGGAAEHVDVRVAREEQEYVGRLQPKDAAPREIRAGTCAEVVRAIATIARLSMDDQPSPPAEPPHREGAPVSPPPIPAPAAAPRVSPWTLAVGVGFGADSGLLGAPAFAGGGFLDVDHGPSWPVAARIGFEQSIPETRDFARAFRTVGRAEVCPWVGRLGPVRAAPCGRFDAGVVRVLGENVPNARSRTLPWLEWGVLARAAVEPVQGLRLGIDFGVFAPLFHHAVELAGGGARRELPAWALRTGIFAAIAFR